MVSKKNFELIIYLRFYEIALQSLDLFHELNP
jgi:hypothetical protein